MQNPPGQNALALDNRITYNASVIPLPNADWGELKQLTMQKVVAQSVSGPGCAISRWRGMSMIQRWNIAPALAALLAVLCTPPYLLAQSGAGTIQGTVQDTSSAPIPGAAVKALNQATGVVIETTAN